MDWGFTIAGILIIIFIVFVIFSLVITVIVKHIRTSSGKSFTRKQFYLTLVLSFIILILISGYICAV